MLMMKTAAFWVVRDANHGTGGAGHGMLTMTIMKQNHHHHHQNHPPIKSWTRKQLWKDPDIHPCIPACTHTIPAGTVESTPGRILDPKPRVKYPGPRVMSRVRGSLCWGLCFSALLR